MIENDQKRTHQKQHRKSDGQCKRGDMMDFMRAIKIELMELGQCQRSSRRFGESEQGEVEEQQS